MKGLFCCDSSVPKTAVKDGRVVAAVCLGAMYMVQIQVYVKYEKRIHVGPILYMQQLYLMHLHWAV